MQKTLTTCLLATAAFCARAKSNLISYALEYILYFRALRKRWLWLFIILNVLQCYWCHSAAGNVTYAFYYGVMCWTAADW